MATSPDGPPFTLKSRAKQDKRGRRCTRLATVPEDALPPPLPSEANGEKKERAESEERETGQKPPEAILVRRGLKPEVKQFLVESFATFQSLTAIQDQLAKRFGLVLDLRTIIGFDVSRPKARVGQRLRKLYAETRLAYIKGTAEVAISHQAHRLRLVSRIVEKASNSKDYAAALKGLELAAKEMGGALTAQSVVRHEGMVGHVHATIEEARRELSARLQQVVDAGHLIPMATDVLPPALPTPPTGEG